MGRRTLKIVLALILAVLVPSRAYASTLVGSYDIPQDADAVACDFLGYDYDTMDSGLRALLHNSTVGGGSGTDSNPNFAGYAAFRDSLYSPALMGDYQWYSRYDGFMFVDAVDQARSDVAGAVRWWDTYGGDDGGGNVDETVPLSNPVTLAYQFGVDYNGGQISGTRSLNNTANTQFNQWIQNNNITDVVIINMYIKAGSSSLQRVNVYGSTGSIDVTKEQVGQAWTSAGYVPTYNITLTTSGSLYYSYNNGYFSDGSMNITITALAPLNYTTETMNAVVGVFSYGAAFDATPSGPSGGPVPEPTPTQPQVPSGPTFSPTVNINTGSGGTVDLSPITERLDVMNQNFIDFAESFHEYWEWWGEMMADLDEQLQGYSSTIATWLQMIYERLSSLSSPNPSTQPTGWLDWLSALLAALVGDLPSAISGIQQSLSGLRNLFPFSIPWDLGILLGLFVSSPVTPVFDLPFAYSATNTAYIHIDCSQWDGVMSAVRSVELVAFAAALALRTRELIKGVEVD